jgi:hypothetical protein
MKSLTSILKQGRTFAMVLAMTLSQVSIANADTSLQNPLNFSDIQSFVAGALKALVAIALPVIVLFIVVSGFMFIAARGNQDALRRAKDNFMWVIIGAALILGAWTLATLIGGTVSQVVGK